MCQSGDLVSISFYLKAVRLLYYFTVLLHSCKTAALLRVVSHSVPYCCVNCTVGRPQSRDVPSQGHMTLRLSVASSGMAGVRNRNLGSGDLGLSVVRLLKGPHPYRCGLSASSLLMASSKAEYSSALSVRSTHACNGVTAPFTCVSRPLRIMHGRSHLETCVTRKRCWIGGYFRIHDMYAKAMTIQVL